MITAITQDELMAMGSRYHTNFLDEQAGYTLGLASRDGTSLISLLPKGFITEIKNSQDKVSQAMKDGTVTAADYEGAAALQNAAFAIAKLWRSKVMHRCRRAASMGIPMPENLVRVNRAKTAPEVISQMDRMTKLLESHQAALAPDTEALINLGQELTAVLREAEAEQVVKKFRDLPETVKEFYRNKGLLYVGLKVINEAGRELHAGDPEKAAQYNFNILRRNHGRKAQAEVWEGISL
jgi:hypothetical protein